MRNENVHETQPTERDDLKHTDTVFASQTPDSNPVGGDPAGYEQSINPLGEVPPAAQGDPAAEDAPISNRTDRNPANLGDDIPEQGDLVHPAPVNAPVGKMPGM
jgi:hypothetical protein